MLQGVWEGGGGATNTRIALRVDLASPCRSPRRLAAAPRSSRAPAARRQPVAARLWAMAAATCLIGVQQDRATEVHLGGPVHADGARASGGERAGLVLGPGDRGAARQANAGVGLRGAPRARRLCMALQARLPVRGGAVCGGGHCTLKQFAKLISLRLSATCDGARRTHPRARTLPRAQAAARGATHLQP